jgi:23S rRNA (cytidine1920-2'-O)/16S rRNA (cytidine1409-2'-O)-methyltransferase
MSATPPADRSYVSRAGHKLDAALAAFHIHPAGQTCADLGCNVGGFTHCLLQHGAQRVYAVDTGYGTLAYPLRTDPRVVVMERTNAMHVALPEPVDLVTIDVGWTRQHHILPNAKKLTQPTGHIITLIKPHYEAASKQLKAGLLDKTTAEQIVQETCDRIAATGLTLQQCIPSPLPGRKGNIEYLALLTPDQPGN